MKHRKLNLRQKRFAREIAKAKTVNEALINAGYSKTYADSRGYYVQDNASVNALIQSNLNAAMEKAGIDDDSLATLVKQGLEANRIARFQGEIKGEEPDWFIRHRFAELCMKVRGDFAPEKHTFSLEKDQAEQSFQARVQKLQALESGKKAQETEPEIEEINPQEETQEPEEDKPLEDKDL